MLFVIDGTDGTGKETQTNLLKERLLKEFKVKKVSFPNYESSIGEMIKSYLKGDFGTLDTVNPYMVSTLYALDRLNSFNNDWRNNYENGDIIICDRYTTSNIIHQTTRLKNKDSYIKWLKDYEYRKLGLPFPDLVFYLDMPIEKTIELRKERLNKFNGSQEQDIHERNTKYLKECYNNAKEIAKKENWFVIDCLNENGELKSIQEINDIVYNKIKLYIALFGK